MFIKDILFHRTVINKRRLSAVAIVLLLLFSPVSCSLKGAVKKCSFKADKITIRDLTNDGFKAVVTFKIKNPNWIGLTVEQLEYSILVNDKELGSGKTESRISIPGRGKTTVDVSVDVKLTEISGSLFKIFLAGKMEYQVKGKAVFSTLLGNVEYPFDLIKKIKPFKKNGVS